MEFGKIEDAPEGAVDVREIAALSEIRALFAESAALKADADELKETTKEKVSELHRKSRQRYLDASGKLQELLK